MSSGMNKGTSGSQTPSTKGSTNTMGTTPPR
jgi:hypothetical protein